VGDSQLAVWLAVADDVLHAVRRSATDAACVEIVLYRLDEGPGFRRVDEQAVHVGARAAGVRFGVPIHSDIEDARASHLRADPLDRPDACASALVQAGHEIPVHLRGGISGAHRTKVDAVTAEPVMNVVP